MARWGLLHVLSATVALQAALRLKPVPQEVGEPPITEPSGKQQDCDQEPKGDDEEDANLQGRHFGPVLHDHSMSPGGVTKVRCDTALVFRKEVLFMWLFPAALIIGALLLGLIGPRLLR